MAWIRPQDARFIDLGRTNNALFMDEAYCETADGDWQGAGRLHEKQVPSQAESVGRTSVGSAAFLVGYHVGGTLSS